MRNWICRYPGFRTDEDDGDDNADDWAEGEGRVAAKDGNFVSKSCERSRWVASPCLLQFPTLVLLKWEIELQNKYMAGVYGCICFRTNCRKCFLSSLLFCVFASCQIELLVICRLWTGVGSLLCLVAPSTWPLFHSTMLGHATTCQGKDQCKYQIPVQRPKLSQSSSPQSGSSRCRSVVGRLAGLSAVG